MSKRLLALLLAYYAFSGVALYKLWQDFHTYNRFYDETFPATAVSCLVIVVAVFLPAMIYLVWEYSGVGGSSDGAR